MELSLWGICQIAQRFVTYQIVTMYFGAKPWKARSERLNYFPAHYFCLPLALSPAPATCFIPIRCPSDILPADKENSATYGIITKLPFCPWHFYSLINIFLSAWKSQSTLLNLKSICFVRTGSLFRFILEKLVGSMLNHF